MKKISWHKLFYVVVFTFCFGVLFRGDVYCLKAEDTSPVEKIIILLDVSGTMRENDKNQEAIECVRNICSLCRDEKFQVFIETFSDKVSLNDGTGTEVLWDGDWITSDTLNKINASLDRVTYTGKKTDQLGALLWAEDNFFPEADSSCIVVILSDGELDYQNRGPGDQKSRTAEEEAAVSEFKLKCEELGNKGCNVILVGFPNNVEMFEELGGKAGITYIFQDTNSSETTLDKTMIYISDKLKLPIKIISGNLKDRRVEFTLEKDCKKVILQINNDDNVNITKENIHLIYNEEEGEQPCEITNSPNSFRIIMTDARKGHYVASLGVGSSDSKYTVITQSEQETISLDVLLFDGQKNELTKNESGNFVVEENMLPVTIRVMKPQGAEITNITNLVYTLNNEESKYTFEEEDTGASYRAELRDLLESKKYYCYINGKLGESNAEKMIIIDCKINEESSIQEEKNIKVREKVKLINDKIRKEGYSGDELRVEIDGEEIAPDTKTKIYKIDQEFTVIFNKPDKYKIKLYKNEELIREICCNVTSSSWEKYIGIAACIVVVFSGLMAWIRKTRGE